MLKAEKLTNELLKVVFDLNQEVCRLLQSDEKFFFVIIAAKLIDYNEEFVCDLHVSLQLKQSLRDPASI